MGISSTVIFSCIFLVYNLSSCNAQTCGSPTGVICLDQTSYVNCENSEPVLVTPQRCGTDTLCYGTAATSAEICRPAPCTNVVQSYLLTGAPENFYYTCISATERYLRICPSGPFDATSGACAVVATTITAGTTIAAETTTAGTTIAAETTTAGTTIVADTTIAAETTTAAATTTAGTTIAADTTTAGTTIVADTTIAAETTTAAATTTAGTTIAAETTTAGTTIVADTTIAAETTTAAATTTAGTTIAAESTTAAKTTTAGTTTPPCIGYRRMVDPTSCNHFYVCGISGAARRLKCPFRFRFNANIRICTFRFLTVCGNRPENV